MLLPHSDAFCTWQNANPSLTAQQAFVSFTGVVHGRGQTPAGASDRRPSSLARYMREGCELSKTRGVVQRGGDRWSKFVQCRRNERTRSARGEEQGKLQTERETRAASGHEGGQACCRWRLGPRPQGSGRGAAAVALPRRACGRCCCRCLAAGGSNPSSLWKVLSLEEVVWRAPRDLGLASARRGVELRGGAGKRRRHIYRHVFLRQPQDMGTHVCKHTG